MVNLSQVLIRKEEYEKQMGVELPFVLHGFFITFANIYTQNNRRRKLKFINRKSF